MVTFFLPFDIDGHSFAIIICHVNVPKFNVRVYFVPSSYDQLGSCISLSLEDVIKDISIPFIFMVIYFRCVKSTQRLSFYTDVYFGNST